MLVAGGSMVLSPMGIPRDAPLTVMRETIAILRQLWRGEEVTWQGKRYNLERARLHDGQPHAIPIWLAVRGEKMLELAGQEADGVVLMAKSDVGPALAIMEQGEAGRSAQVTRVYLDRIAYTPEMLAEASALYTYALHGLAPAHARRHGHRPRRKSRRSARPWPQAGRRPLPATSARR